MSGRAVVRVTRNLVRRWPPPPLDGTHGKKERGTVLVIGGSERNPGGVLLAGIAALRAGAGTLQIASARRVVPMLAVAVPEARVTGMATNRDGELSARIGTRVRRDAECCDAMLIGPGMIAVSAAAPLLRAASGPVVLDGAAMMALQDRKRHDEHAKVVITPHAGELARLMDVERDEVTARPLELATRAARVLHVIVALKGPKTYVVAPTGESFVSVAGNLGLGTSGSGDTLAGLIVGLCARGATPLQAAVLGVFSHGLAGERLARRIAPLGYLARELLAEAPRVLADLRAC